MIDVKMVTLWAKLNILSHFDSPTPYPEGFSYPFLIMGQPWPLLLPFHCKAFFTIMFYKLGLQ